MSKTFVFSFKAFNIWTVLLQIGHLTTRCVCEEITSGTIPSFKWKDLKPSICVYEENYTLPVIDLKIMLTVNAVYDISEARMEYGMAVQLVEVWSDPYIKLPDEMTEFEGNKIIPPWFLRCLWQPDTIFQNSKEVKLFDQTLPNKYTKLTFPIGYIYRSGIYKLTVACGMDFHLYPLDSQNCSMNIALLYSRKSEVDLGWVIELDTLNIRPIRLNFKIKPLNFKIVFLNPTLSERRRTRNEISQILHANLLFVRSLTASVVNTYIPSGLIVCLSMVSFWLDVAAVPGRVTLGVTAILTLSTQIVSTRNSLPTLDYMTAMDIWLLGCMVMVFLSLIEFTCAQALTRRKVGSETPREKKEDSKKPKYLSSSREKNLTAWALPYRTELPTRVMKLIKRPKTSPKSLFSRIKRKIIKDKPPKKKDNLLDRVCRFLFPTMMILFTGLYFWHFCGEAKKISNNIGEIVEF